MTSDRVSRLAATSNLPVTSHAAADAAWTQLVARARDAWPTVTFDEAQLVDFIGPRLAAAPDLPSAIAACPAADLALAAACAAQEPTAHAAFDAILTEVDAAGSSTGSTKDLVVEVKQLLRLQLLVPKDGKPPGITGYQGKGPLRGWVRITATRELIRHKKKQARETPLETKTERSLEEAIGGSAGGGDPLLEQLKAEYRTEFAIALREAIADLTAEDRTLLQQQIVEGLSIDELGAAYGVHRATAARWYNRARAALVAATHKRLADRLKMPVDQIESVIRLVQSRLDASVIRYLRES